MAFFNGAARCALCAKKKTTKRGCDGASLTVSMNKPIQETASTPFARRISKQELTMACRLSYSLTTTVTVKNRNYISRQLVTLGLSTVNGRLDTSSLSTSQLEELESWRSDDKWDSACATFGRQTRSWRERRLREKDPFYARPIPETEHPDPILRQAGVLLGRELPTLYGGDLRELMRWIVMAGAYTRKYNRAAVLHRAIALHLGPRSR